MRPARRSAANRLENLESAVLRDRAHAGELLREFFLVGQMPVGDHPQAATGFQRSRGDGDEAAANVGPAGAPLGMERWVADDHVITLVQSAGDIVPVETERDALRIG